MCYHSYLNGYIMKLTDEYRAYNTLLYSIGKLIPSAFQMSLRDFGIVYINIIIGNLTVNFQIFTVELPISSLIYTISKFPNHHWHAERISFPMMYHTVLYTLYSACASQFNNILIVVTMVTHIFPPKWFSWQPKSCELSMISLLIRIPNMVKIGIELAKLQS